MIYLETILFCIGFLLVCGEITTNTRKFVNGNSMRSTGLGIVILMAGIIYFSLSAISLGELAEAQEASLEYKNNNTRKEEIERLPTSQRAAISIKLARQRFVAGENNVEIINDVGLWILFEPSKEDLKARHTYLEKIFGIQQKQTEIFFQQNAAEQEATRWAIVLIMAIALKLIARRFYLISRSFN